MGVPWLGELPRRLCSPCFWEDHLCEEGRELSDDVFCGALELALAGGDNICPATGREVSTLRLALTLGLLQDELTKAARIVLWRADWLSNFACAADFRVLLCGPSRGTRSRRPCWLEVCVSSSLCRLRVAYSCRA